MVVTLFEFEHDYDGSGNGDSYCIDFDSRGMLTCSVQSYQIDSWGTGTLPREKTRELYEAMKEYYEL